MALTDILQVAADAQTAKATVIDVAALFKQYFGTSPKAFIPAFPAAGAGGNAAQITSIVNKTTTFQGIDLYATDEISGQEIFLPISIVAKGNTYNFPYCVISFSRGKRWIETPMTELDGEVNELISKKSYDITIKGFLIGIYGTFPDTQIDDLRKVFEIDEAVSLQCALTDIFLHTSDKVIIKDFDMPAKVGVVGVRDFTMKLKTDSIFTLYVD